MDKKENPKVNQVIRKRQLLNEDIKNELKMNPCIIDKEAFMDALHNNFRRFIQDNYKD